MTREVHLVDVFTDGAGGGNPAPTVVDAGDMSDAEMRDVARRYGHESGFVLPAPAGSGCDFEFRFWVPNHEMEMCGHATVGAVWILDRLGLLPLDKLTILTRSGRVQARVAGWDASGAQVEITQPVGQVETISPDSEADILSVLGLSRADLAPLPIQNAWTSRIKTLVPVASVARLDAIIPDFTRIEAVCAAIGSTGLYPYAVSDAAGQVFDARQFPKSSGYPEDAATGIAAAALAFGLLRNGSVDADRLVHVRQGRAMGRPSRIKIRFSKDLGGVADGCWLGGPCALHPHPASA
jgi:PhzF family phenazine biosynthesis protein